MRPKPIDLNPEDVKALLERAEKGVLEEGDYAIIKAMVETISLLSQSIDDKATAIKRLLRMLFGASTEKSPSYTGTTTMPVSETCRRRNVSLSIRKKAGR